MGMRQARVRLAFAAILVIATSQSFAQNTDNGCTFETCKAGTRALTSYDQSDPYYFCPTRELADYVGTLVALFAGQIMLTGEMPNISDKTGEPEYKGQTKIMVDALREKAGVRTFDQAVAICSPGVDKEPVMVLNMPENSLVAYVEDERRKLAFWMPIINLNKLK
jgi:hypothetical protein